MLSILLQNSLFTFVYGKKISHGSVTSLLFHMLYEHRTKMLSVFSNIYSLVWHTWLDNYFLDHWRGKHKEKIQPSWQINDPSAKRSLTGVKCFMGTMETFKGFVFSYCKTINLNTHIQKYLKKYKTANIYWRKLLQKYLRKVLNFTTASQSDTSWQLNNTG